MTNADLISEYDFSFLKERFRENFECTENEYEEIVDELKKFLTLVLLQDKSLAVIGKGVDELWHTFIIHTPQYREFCDKVFGEYIDHQPHGPKTPVPEEALTNFFEVYTDKYGTVPSTWTDGYDNAVIASLQGGSVPKDFAYKWSGWTGRSPRKGQ